MKFKNIIFALSAMAFLGACKSGQNTIAETPQRGGQRGGPPSAEEVFKMDADGDGLISKAEAQGGLAEHFSEIDKNNDGYITRSEFDAVPKPERGQRSPRK